MHRFTGLIVAAAIVVTGCAPGATTVAGKPGAASSPIAGGLQPPLGVRVQDGNLEFAALGVATTQTVGDPKEPGLSVNARGVFVVVTVSIRNTGDKAITFIDSYQKLTDKQGRAFEVSNAADIYGNRDVPSTKIQPGDGLVVRLAFDVPTDTVPATLLLRESEFSTGVTARL